VSRKAVKTIAHRMIGQVAGETGMSRREIYRMLSEKSGIPLSGVHFRYMGKQRCLALIEIMEKLLNERRGMR
jgi:cytidylate kinase